MNIPAKFEADLPQLQSIVATHSSYQLAFASVTGSYAYGCHSPSSDYDIHGVHLLSVQEILGLDQTCETIERKVEHPGEDVEELDIATHDLRKCVRLLLKGNGNVLEDVYSPLVISSSSIHEELRDLGQGCITKQLALHYKGHAFNQQRRMKLNNLKQFLHMYRCLLMGLYLMQTGTLEMHLPSLADEYSYPAVHDLIAYKLAGFDFIPGNALAGHFQNVETLLVRLDMARERSHLPEKASATIHKQLEDFVIRVRLEGK